jgi:hypothetical protein
MKFNSADLERYQMEFDENDSTFAQSELNAKYGIDLSKVPETQQRLLQGFVKYGASRAMMDLIGNEIERQLLPSE